MPVTRRVGGGGDHGVDPRPRLLPVRSQLFGNASWLSVSAQKDARGLNTSAVVVRIVNSLPAAEVPDDVSPGVAINLDVACKACTGTIMSAAPTDANPPYEPLRVSPKPLSCEVQGGNKVWMALVPSSYAVLQLSGCHQYYFTPTR